ncbi:hypothetical protein ACMZ49_23430, partial [Alcaligenes phenolicus]
YLSVLTIRIWWRRRVMPDVFFHRILQPFDVSFRREGHEGLFAESYATEYGGGSSPLLGEFFQITFD